MLDGKPIYDSYKDTGIPWLAEVPTEWDIQRAKWLFHKMERPVRAEDDVVTAFRDGQVTLRTNRRTEGFTNAIQEHGYQGIREGDLVIHAMDAFAGAIGVSESNGKSSPVYAACVPRGLFDVSPRYYAYALRYVALSGYILSLAKGIRERSTDFRFKDFGEMNMPVPDLDTQNRIVRFLDEKTAEIDAAIAKKRRLIELLNEQKAILINRAVTKGLNPDAPMKDSGVDWIGEIPAHWEVKRLKYLFRETNARTSTGKETLFSLRMHAGLVPHDEVSDKSISDGDLVDYKHVAAGQMVMNRMRAAIGIFGVARADGLVSPDYAIFDMSDEVNADYFLRLFKTTIMGMRFRLSSKGLGTGSSGFMRLYTENFGDLKVAIPPMSEQAEISSRIDELAMDFEQVVALTEREISTLNEFRQTLIANAVTGKIKI